MRSALTLEHRANLGDEVRSVAFEAGDELQLMKRFDERALVKDSMGRLFTLPLDALALPDEVGDAGPDDRARARD